MKEQILNRLSSPEELERLRKSIIERRDANKPLITICASSGCHALGSGKIIAAFKQENGEGASSPDGGTGQARYAKGGGGKTHGVSRFLSERTDYGHPS